MSHPDVVPNVLTLSTSSSSSTTISGGIFSILSRRMQKKKLFYHVLGTSIIMTVSDSASCLQGSTIFIIQFTTRPLNLSCFVVYLKLRKCKAKVDQTDYSLTRKNCFTGMKKLSLSVDLDKYLYLFHQRISDKIVPDAKSTEKWKELSQ